MTTLTTEERDTVLELAENGRHADVLAYLCSRPADAVRESPILSLVYGTAYARLGQHAAGLQWVETALSRAQLLKETAVERRALNARGAIALVIGRPDEGADYFTQGLLAASRDNDLAAIGRCANNIGIVANLQGRHAEALSSYAMALAAFEQAGLQVGVAEAHHNLGITHREQGDTDAALASGLRAIEAASTAGDRNLAALALRGCAEIRLHRGELLTARRESAEALDIHREIGDPVQEAEDLRIVAGVLALDGQLDEAETTLREVIERATAHERPQLVAEAWRDIALLLHRSDRTAEAREAALAARASFTRLGAEYELRQLAEHVWGDELGAELRESLRPLHEAQRMADTGRYAALMAYLEARPDEEIDRSPTLLLLKGVGHARLGHLDVAQHWALTALSRARACGDRVVEVRALNVNGAIALERGGINQAIHYLARAQEEAMLDGDHATVGRAANNLGVIANMQGEYGRAVGSYTMAMAAYQRARLDHGVAESQHNLSIAYREQGRLNDALHAANKAVRLAGQAGDASLRAQAIAGRAEIRIAQGDTQMAIREAQLAGDTHRELHDPLRETEDQRILANAIAASGRIDEALAMLRKVITQARAHARPLLVAIAQRDLAGVLFQQNHGTEARDEARQARAALEQLGAAVEVEKLDKLLAS